MARAGELSNLHRATAARVSLNRVLVNQLNLSATSTVDDSRTAPQGEPFYYQISENQIKIPRASIGDLPSSWKQKQKLVGAKEFLDARLYWSDDERWHSNSRQKRLIKQRRIAGLSDTPTRPMTVSAVKARIQRQRRKLSSADETAANSEEESSSEPPMPWPRQVLQRRNSEPREMHETDFGNNGFQNASAIVYQSSTNPDVIYRKTRSSDSNRARSHSWSRSWSQAPWLQEEFQTQGSRLGSAAAQHRSVRQGRRQLMPFNGRHSLNSLDPKQQRREAAEIGQFYIPGDQVAKAPAAAPKTRFKKRRETDQENYADRFSQFWIDTVANQNIYSPIDDSIPQPAAAARIGAQASKNSRFFRVSVEPPKVVVQCNYTGQQRLPKYQLKRNYGVF